MKYSAGRDHCLTLINEGWKFGPLLEYLWSQQKGSVERLIGEVYSAILRASQPVYENEPFSIKLPECQRVLSTYYDADHLAGDLLAVGEQIERIEWKMREERRALFARRFDNRGAARTGAANKARFEDSRKRREIIAAILADLDLTTHRAKSSGRVLVRPLARYIASPKPFDGRTKSDIGVAQIEKMIKSLLKK